MDIKDVEKNVEDAAALLKALSNPRRLMILCALFEHPERSVGELERFVGISQSALSQHLARLRRYGLVNARREAQNVFYSLKGEKVLAILKTLHDLYCPSYAKEQAPPA